MPGNWMNTISGRHYPVLEPRPDLIDIGDIAWSLSLSCRYNGHVSRHYSVAEHCIHIASFFDNRDKKLWALLHDASEAYLGDVVRPLKHTLAMAEYRELEYKTMEIVAKRFDLGEEPDDVKLADNAIVYLEALYLQNSFIRDWDQHGDEEVRQFLATNRGAVDVVIDRLRDPKWKHPQEVFNEFMTIWREVTQ